MQEKANIRKRGKQNNRKEKLPKSTLNCNDQQKEARTNKLYRNNKKSNIKINDNS